MTSTKQHREEMTEALEEVIEVERHLHGREFWWGSDGSPDTTTSIDANVDTPFVAVSGNDDWGTAISILGDDDVPAKAGDTRIDLHRFLITDTDHSTPYRMRVIWGTGTSGDAITAGQWSEFMFITASGPFLSGGPVDVMMPRIPVDRAWVQVWNVNNSSNVDFFYGVHGYAT